MGKNSKAKAKKANKANSDSNSAPKANDADSKKTSSDADSKKASSDADPKKANSDADVDGTASKTSKSQSALKTFGYGAATGGAGLLGLLAMGSGDGLLGGTGNLLFGDMFDGYGPMVAVGSCCSSSCLFVCVLAVMLVATSGGDGNKN